MRELLIIYTDHADRENISLVTKNTYQIIRNVFKDKFLFYTPGITALELQESGTLTKYPQLGSDESEKKFNAFLKGFIKEYEHIVLMSTRIEKLTAEIINDAFYQLHSHDYVIGPSNMGSYYLVGMKRLDPFFFERNFDGSIYQDILQYFRNKTASYFELPLLQEERELVRINKN